MTDELDRAGDGTLYDEEPHGEFGDIEALAEAYRDHHPVPETPPRASALNEARDLITGDRNAQYGPPTQDFKRTADALTALGYRRLDVDGVTPVDLLPSDVAILIAMVKMSRLMHSRDKRDNWVDLAGYAGCGYECTTEEN